jgi:5-methylcytosine-specific restriction endonuclease McrA
MPSNWDNWKRNKEKYHPNFDRRSKSRKKRVKYICEQCGARQGDTRVNKRGEPYKVMVAAAHVNHDPQNARAKLIILCQQCHLRHDGPEHGKNARRTFYRKKREAAINSGQLELPLKLRRMAQ